MNTAKTSLTNMTWINFKPMLKSKLNHVNKRGTILLHVIGDITKTVANCANWHPKVSSMMENHIRFPYCLKNEITFQWRQLCFLNNSWMKCRYIRSGINIATSCLIMSDHIVYHQHSNFICALQNHWKLDCFLSILFSLTKKWNTEIRTTDTYSHKKLVMRKFFHAIMME